MVAMAGVKKAIFDRLCKQLEKTGQQIDSAYSIVQENVDLLVKVRYFQLANWLLFEFCI